MTLGEHITNNQSNFKFVPILNKIKECLIAPCFAFTQILLPLDEQDRMPNHGEVNIKIYKKTCQHGIK
jgi:hypothetical protein